jgi:hypothetical protein
MILHRCIKLRTMLHTQNLIRTILHLTDWLRTLSKHCYILRTMYHTQEHDQYQNKGTETETQFITENLKLSLSHYRGIKLSLSHYREPETAQHSTRFYHILSPEHHLTKHCQHPYLTKQHMCSHCQHSYLIKQSYLHPHPHPRHSHFS